MIVRTLQSDLHLWITGLLSLMDISPVVRPRPVVTTPLACVTSTEQKRLPFFVVRARRKHATHSRRTMVRSGKEPAAPDDASTQLVHAWNCSREALDRDSPPPVFPRAERCSEPAVPTFPCAATMEEARPGVEILYADSGISAIIAKRTRGSESFRARESERVSRLTVTSDVICPS